MANRPRRESESFEEYREWLKMAKKVEKMRAQGVVVKPSYFKQKKEKRNDGRAFRKN